VELHVPDQLVRGLDLTEAQWLLDLAIGLFVDRRVTLGRGAEIAGISKPVFLDELGKRKIPINYDATDLESDLRTISQLQRDDPILAPWPERAKRIESFYNPESAW
jgi:predicted HTH domain antitoxin